MKHIINIQSFGDLITNSSSEVYCMYTRQGAKQIEDAIKQIASCLNPKINIDDHLDISCTINKEWEVYDDETDQYISGEEYYNRKYSEFCENRTNEQILLDFNNFNNNLIKNIENDYDINYRALDIEIDAKTELGEQLRAAIFNILYAFEYEEHYD